MRGDVEFLNGVDRQVDVLAAHEHVRIVAAVDGHEQIPPALSIDGDGGHVALGRVIVLIYCAVARGYAGNERGQRGEIAPVNRQLIHLERSNGLVERGRVRFDQRHQGLHRHFLLHPARFQLDVQVE